MAAEPGRFADDWRHLGHYRVLSMLGAGGMGEVYRAHDERLDRDVALKVLPASTFEEATARARLVREARAAAALNHASICTIHDVGEAEGQAYIAMELVEGTPLSEHSHGRILPMARVTHAIRQQRFVRPVALMTARFRAPMVA